MFQAAFDKIKERTNQQNQYPSYNETQQRVADQNGENRATGLIKKVGQAGEAAGRMMNSTQGSGSAGGATYTTNANNQPYINQLNELYDRVMNRKPFQYDLNGDLLYQQMADQYTMLGKQAMMDTMGQAAALTGGYGNSYAQSVGNQAYQQYLSGLNEQIPALYQQAYNVYQGDTDRLLQQYELAAQHPDIVDALSPKTVTVDSSDGTADYAAALLKALTTGGEYRNELANWVYNPYNKK